MQRNRFLQLFLAAAIVALPGLGAASAEEQSLLTAEGTLHVVRTGRAVDLGIPDASIWPDSVLVEWTSRAQDNSLSTAILPGTDTPSMKRGLKLAFDDQTGALLVLWTEYMSVYSQIRVGVLHHGTWTNSGLLPSQGFSGAYNPEMRITHQTVRYRDEQDNPVTKTSSILSIIWWEDSRDGQARYAALFLDEQGPDPTNLAIHDLTALLGGGGEPDYEGVPSGAYLFPSLQADGLSGALLASFADLHDQRLRVVRITFPEDQGSPSEPGNLKWKRRHIPIVGVTNDAPIPRMVPSGPAASAMMVGTSIGAGYRPTVYWRDGDSLRYSRLEGSDWSAIRSIALDETMSYDRALGLVIGMAERK